MADFNYRVAPFAHQREWFERTRREAAHALLWEMGTGKSKVVIDTAAWLFQQGEIKGLLLVAPSGPHLNWEVKELPEHMTPDVRYDVLTWDAGAAQTKTWQKALEWMIEACPGLPVLLLTYDALITKRGAAAAGAFLARRRSMLVFDESIHAANPTSARGKAAAALATMAPFRRILSGTPAPDSPFSLYGQYRLLDRRILGFEKSFWLFKQEYGEYRTRFLGPGRSFPELVGYRNLEQLKQKIAPYSSRVRKEDALDLPAKVYVRRMVELTSEQRAAYDRVRDDVLGEDLENMEPVNALTRLLRLQQVVCGYVVADRDQPPERIPSNRAQAVRDVVDKDDSPTIVWARFRQDIDMIADVLPRELTVQYHGGLDDRACQESVRAFQAGEARYFLATQQKAAEGLTLTAARKVIYYSNTFRLKDRLQSEDRAHRIGQRFPVTYIDLEAHGTVDGHIIKTLVRKHDIAAMVTGDRLRSWLRGGVEPEVVLDPALLEYEQDALLGQYFTT